MEKQEYIRPEIDRVSIDNEISVVLMSNQAGTTGGPLQLPDDPAML